MERCPTLNRTGMAADGSRYCQGPGIIEEQDIKRTTGVEISNCSKGHRRDSSSRHLVDVVIGNFAINFATDRDRVFRKANRALKPGERTAYRTPRFRAVFTTYLRPRAAARSRAAVAAKQSGRGDNCYALSAFPLEMS